MADPQGGDVTFALISGISWSVAITSWRQASSQGELIKAWARLIFYKLILTGQITCPETTNPRPVLDSPMLSQDLAIS